MAPPERKESSSREFSSKIHKPNIKGPWAVCKRSNKGLQGLLPPMKKHLEQCHPDFEPCDKSHRGRGQSSACEIERVIANWKAMSGCVAK